MTFAFIVGELGKGGQERQLIYLLKQLIAEGSSICLIVWSFDKKNVSFLDHSELAEINVLKLSTESTLSKIIKSRAFIKANQSRTLHSFTFYLNFFTWLICLATSVKPIGGIRNRLRMMMHTHPGNVFWLCSIFPRKKISNNKDFKVDLESIIVDFCYSSTAVVTNHLEIEEFKYALPANEEIISSASIGRMYPEKSIDTIIECIEILLKKGYKVVHYHAGNGPLRKKLEQLVEEKQLQLNFIFIGEVESVSDFLRDKHLFLHSSKFEGYPNVLMEAMACGKPIVSTDCGDAKYLVRNGINGFIVDVGDAIEMSNQSQRIIADEELRFNLSKASRKFAITNFKLADLSKQTSDAYNNLGI